MIHRVPSFTAPGSLELDAAGEFMKLSHRRLVEAKAGIQAWRVAGAVWGLTVPYAKGWATAYVGSIESLTGMDNRAVRRGIKECVEAGALEWEPNRWTPPKGTPGRPSLIGLPGAPKTGSSQPGQGARPGRANPVDASKTGSSQPTGITSTSDHRYAGTEVVSNAHDRDPSGSAPRPDELRSMLEGLTVDELHEGVAKYAPTVAAWYAEELERRNVAPRRRPAWLDHHEGEA